jgi:hypothetical protein
MALAGHTVGQRRSGLIALGIRRYIGSVRRDVVLEATAILKRTTPIATHHAESNWIPSMGHPHVGVDGSREGVSFAAQEAGIAEVADEPPESKRVANLTNNVGYISALNNGTSLQAGEGFVESAIAQAIVNVRARRGVLPRAG